MDRVCWNITNVCNDNCNFCFREGKSNPVSLQTAYVIIDNLFCSGIKHIAFSGGEALMYDGIYELLEYVCSLGLEITLITNCILLNDKCLEKLKNIVEWIAIPIDCFENNIMYGRNIHHIKNVERSLKCIEQSDKNVSVKINTVLTSKNYNNIMTIYSYIHNFKCVKRWNIFEFVDIRGNAIQNSNTYQLTLEQLEYVKQCLKGRDMDKRLRVVLKSRKTLISSYIVINPEGLIVIYNENTKQEDVLGDLKREKLSEIIDRNYIKYDLNCYEKRIGENNLIFV